MPHKKYIQPGVCWFINTSCSVVMDAMDQNLSLAVTHLLLERKNMSFQVQGVVIYTLLVEAFATGIENLDW